MEYLTKVVRNSFRRKYWPHPLLWVDYGYCGFIVLACFSVSFLPIFSKELAPSPCVLDIVNCHTLSFPNSQLQRMGTWVSQTRVLATLLPKLVRKMLSCLWLHCRKDTSLDHWTAIFPSLAEEAISSKRVCDSHTKKSRGEKSKRWKNIVSVSGLNSFEVNNF